MMEAAAGTLLLGSLLTVAVGLILVRGARAEALGCFGMAGVLLSGAALIQGRPTLAAATGSFTALALLATALLTARRPLPRWLPVAALAYTAIRVALVRGGFADLSHLLAIGVEPTLLGWAARITWGVDWGPPAFARWFAPAGMATLAVFELAAHAVLLGGASTPPHLASVVLVGTASLLLIGAAFQRSGLRSERAEARLEQTRVRFDAIANSGYDLIVELDERFDVTWVSPSAVSQLGYASHEMVGKPGEAFVHAEDLVRLHETVHPLEPGQSVAHPPVRARMRDGDWRWVEGTARCYLDGEGRHRISVVARDVTHRIATEAALREREDRLRILELHSRDAFAELAADGRVLNVSRNVFDLLGYPPDEIVDRPLADVIRRVGLPDDGAFEEVAEHIRRRGRFQHLGRLRHRDGSLRSIETNLNGYRLPNGENRFVAVARDVSERVRIEENLRAARKNESLGLLAGGIAHDFNNVLMGIIGNVGVLQDRLAIDSELRPLVAEIEAAADRASDLTDQLLAYAGRGELRPQRIDLSRLADELVRLLGRTFSDEFRLQCKLAEPVHVLGEGIRLRQALLALLTNAREALPASGGSVTLSTGVAELDAERLASMEFGSELAPGRHAYLEVVDDGEGMDAETRDRLFDPFFSNRGRGRGLGMTSVLGIARSHGAAVEVITAPRLGTCVRLFFPELDADQLSLAERTSAPLDADWRGHGTVLFVDDEEPIQRLARRTLEERGFRVLLASNGREAVQTFRRHADEIRVVVMDVMMPEMRGDEAFRAMREYAPEVPVVLSSGWGLDECLEDVPSEWLAGFLHKPYRHEALLRCVHDVLEAAEGA